VLLLCASDPDLTHHKRMRYLGWVLAHTEQIVALTIGARGGFDPPTTNKHLVVVNAHTLVIVVSGGQALYKMTSANAG